MSRQAAGNRRAQLGEGVAVADPDRAADLDRRPRRVLGRDAGAIQQEHERRGGSVEDRQLRPVHLDHARCRCRSRQAPPSRARPCRSARRRRASTVASRVSTTRSNRAGMSTPGRSGGTRCHGPPAPGGSQVDAASRNAGRRRRSRSAPSASAGTTWLDAREPGSRQTVHAPCLYLRDRLQASCPSRLGQSMFVSECFRVKPLILRILCRTPCYDDWRRRKAGMSNPTSSPAVCCTDARGWSPGAVLDAARPAGWRRRRNRRRCWRRRNAPVTVLNRLRRAAVRRPPAAGAPAADRARTGRRTVPRPGGAER